jgi:hypothetical protein
LSGRLFGYLARRLDNRATTVRCPPEVRNEQIARLAAFAKGDDRLRDWRRQEYLRLASKFDPSADIPLRVWQQEWPPGTAASVDAFERLLGGLDRCRR